MEKIFNKRLLWYLEEKHFLINGQSEFRQNRSTTDNLIDLESEIHECSANKQEGIAVFFDITKAFDRAWCQDIIAKLHRWNINDNLLLFLISIHCILDNWSTLVKGRLYVDNIVLFCKGKIFIQSKDTSRSQ